MGSTFPFQCISEGLVRTLAPHKQRGRFELEDAALEIFIFFGNVFFAPSVSVNVDVLLPRLGKEKSVSMKFKLYLKI